MTTYLYRCPECQSAFELVPNGVRFRSCRNPGCSGLLTRVSGVALHDESGH